MSDGTKKLWRIRAEVEYLVLADTYREACRLGEDSIDEEVRNGVDVSAEEIEPGEKLYEWADCYPYGGDGEKTCAQYLAPAPNLKPAPGGRDE
jgi:hypothetical protein